MTEKWSFESQSVVISQLESVIRSIHKLKKSGLLLLS